MWTETTRRQYRREDLRYASDMTDAEWALIEPYLPAAKRLGRPRGVAAACGGGSAALSVAHSLALASAAARFSEPLDGAALLLRLAGCGAVENHQFPVAATSPRTDR